MRRFIALCAAVVVVCVATGCTVQTSHSPKAPAVSATTRPSPSGDAPAPARELLSLFIVGDSNSTGFRGTLAAGLESGAAWGSRLASEGFSPIQGWAVDGATTAAMLRGIEGADARADQLIVMAGTNDLATGSTAEEILANVSLIVEHVEAPAVLLLAIAPIDAIHAEATALNGALARHAVERGWDFFDPWSRVRADGGRWEEGTSPDGVHATDAVYAAVGDAIAEYLIDERVLPR